MALFVVRYVSNLVIFSLGLRAPGIIGSSDSDYQTLNDGPNFRTRYYQGVSLASPCTPNTCLARDQRVKLFVNRAYSEE